MTGQLEHSRGRRSTSGFLSEGEAAFQPTTITKRNAHAQCLLTQNKEYLLEKLYILIPSGYTSVVTTPMTLMKNVLHDLWLCFVVILAISTSKAYPVMAEACTISAAVFPLLSALNRLAGRRDLLKLTFDKTRDWLRKLFDPFSVREIKHACILKRKSAAVIILAIFSKKSKTDNGSSDTQFEAVSSLVWTLSHFYIMLSL